jgi:16S rRNA processing protein RimM
MTASARPPAQAGSGSPGQGEPVYLVVGFLRRPHGVQGEILMDVRTDFPERIKPGITVYVGENHRMMTISSRRQHAQGLLLSFKGLENREEAGQYRNQYIYVQAAGLPELPEGEYYHHQLVGLQVVDEDGRLLGELAEVLETGANDVYVVSRPDGTEILLPAIPPVILDVDMSRRTMSVHLLPGLLDEAFEA